MNALTIFLLVTGINAAGMVLFLLNRKKEKQFPHWILIILFGYILMVALHAYGQLFESKFLDIIGFLFADTIGYFAGPAMIVYIQSLFQSKKQLLKSGIFFLPLVLYVLFVSMPSLTNLLFGMNEPYLDKIRSYSFIFNIQAFFLLACLIFAFYLHIRYRSKLKSIYSNLEDKDLNWIRYLLIGMMATIIFYIATAILEDYIAASPLDLSIFTTLILLFTVVYLGYYGLSQSKILLPDFLNVAQEQRSKNAPSHHLKNTSETEINHLKTTLHQILEEKQPHFNPNLSLNDLAEHISTTPKKLTALLNQYLDQSFFDLINTKRVEAVKERLQNGDHEQLTLLAIAFDCGFNSKSSFNRTFKKYTGTTPKNYILSLKSNQN
ncbi:MAG: helix-turn-helix transcriptional regulator [Bacteroidota bacterium]